MAKSFAFSFGRFNPPPIGHEKLMENTRRANRNYRIYASQSQDSRKNPLSFRNKVAIMKSMFPAHARKISSDKMTTAIDAMVQLYKEKHTDVVMVVGSDRVGEFDKLLKTYNGKRARHGYYKFKSIRVVSAGERDPDAEGVSGMSASKMRKAAQDNDYKSFQKGLPPKLKQGKLLFKTLQKEMGIKSLKEWTTYSQRISQPVPQGNLSGAGGTTVFPEIDDGVTQREVAPPGWGHTKAEKEKTKPDKPKSKIGGTAHEFKKDLDSGKFKGFPGDKTYKDKKASMFKLMWSMKKKGDKPHYKPGEKDVLKKKYRGKDGKNEASEVKFNPLPKKKDKGPTPADQLLPKNTSRSIVAGDDIEGFKERLDRLEVETYINSNTK